MQSHMCRSKGDDVMRPFHKWLQAAYEKQEFTPYNKFSIINQNSHFWVINWEILSQMHIYGKDFVNILGKLSAKIVFNKDI